MRHAGKEPFPTIYVDSKDEQKQYDVAAKSQLKKIQKIWCRENFKTAEKAKVDEENIEKRQQNLEEAKKIVLKEDPNLPKATTVKILDGKNFVLHRCYTHVTLWLFYLFRCCLLS